MVVCLSVPGGVPCSSAARASLPYNGRVFKRFFLKPSFIGNKNTEHVHHVNEICKSSFIYLWNHLPHGVCCLVFFLVFFGLGKRESFYSQT